MCNYWTQQAANFDQSPGNIFLWKDMKVPREE